MSVADEQRVVRPQSNGGEGSKTGGDSVGAFEGAVFKTENVNAAGHVIGDKQRLEGRVDAERDRTSEIGCNLLIGTGPDVDVIKDSASGIAEHHPIAAPIENYRTDG